MAFTVLGVPLLTLLLIEGASSGILFLPDVLRAFQAKQSDANMKYDSLLGWVEHPSLYRPDLFGPGIHFRSNAQGFRGSLETTRQPPKGRVRILCSGDSFTQGAGVGDDQTWCALLAARDHRLESVNLGVGGYGLDQAYLRFKRDGQPLEPAVHIIAFIADDFRRMRWTQMGHAGKPILAMREGALEIRNVPVPRFLGKRPKLRALLQSAQELRTVQLAGVVKSRVGAGGGSSAGAMYDTTLAQVVSAMIADLSASRQDGSSLVMLFLPTFGEYLGRSAEPWRELLRGHADPGQDLWYLDLFSDLRRMPPDSALSMFIPDGGARGHYSAAGNEWVADILLKYLNGIPNIAARLNALP